MNRFRFYISSVAITGAFFGYLWYAASSENSDENDSEYQASTEVSAVTFLPRNDKAPLESVSKKGGGNATPLTLVSRPQTPFRSTESSRSEHLEIVTTSFSTNSPMKGMAIPSPPKRLPSSEGPPHEIFTLEKVRKNMPNAYMVPESAYPPEHLSSSKPD